MRRTTDICIIGGGPAGSVLATRLAQLGHEVCLVERATFPRRHLGESLSPGVLPLLATAGLHATVVSAECTPVRSVAVNWDQGRQQREDPTGQGMLVDRGNFDRLLLDHARAVGVRVFQPARVVEKALHDDGWHLRIETEGCALELRAAFLADATGRTALLRSHRRPTGCRTVALHAYWQGRGLPAQPRIEAGVAEWYWGVPLPHGVYNTLVFLDATRFRAARASLFSAGFQAMIERSGLLAGCTDARLLGRVRATDATPYLDGESATPRSIKVGDAALTLDPLSSSGVQKAIQTALSGAVVVNTLLRKPELGEPALRFYRDRLREASARHGKWAAEQYGAVAAHRDGTFWRERAAAIPPPASLLPPREPERRVPARLVGGDGWPTGRGGARRSHRLVHGPDAEQWAVEASRETANHGTANEAPLVLSRDVAFVDLPCLEGAFVRVKTAVRHPALEGPVAYLGDWELAPLLHQVRAGMTLHQIALAWAPAIALDDGHAVARWLIGHGILAPQTATQPGGPAPWRPVA